MAKIKVHLDPGVPKLLGKRLVAFFKHIEKIMPVNHRIAVMVVNAMALDMPDEKAVRLRGNNAATFGMFIHPRGRNAMIKDGIWPDKKAEVAIYLAGGIERLSRQNPHINRGKGQFSRNKCHSIVIQHAFHEMSHYIQFRDRKKMTEDDIQDRICRLMYLFAKRSKGMKRKSKNPRERVHFHVKAK